MPIFNKQKLSDKAKELHVVRDTLEKVCRLQKILEFIDSSHLLKESLALKGGTAINLLLFDLPRLSMDIDLDICCPCDKEEMIEERKKITSLITKFMLREDYVLSSKSKYKHSLDYFVFTYLNSGNVKDNIKIEINYSLKNHLLPIEDKVFNSLYDNKTVHTRMVNRIELLASKTVALVSRGAARDLYDIYNMIKFKTLKENELELYRKCFVFYLAITSEEPILNYSTNKIELLTRHDIFTNLVPVLKQNDDFILEQAKSIVIDFLMQNVFHSKIDKLFLYNFKNKLYTPELLFQEENIFLNIKNHPMVVWKMQNHTT